MHNVSFVDAIKIIAIKKLKERYGKYTHDNSEYLSLVHLDNDSLVNEVSPVIDEEPAFLDLWLDLVMRSITEDLSSVIRIKSNNNLQFEFAHRDKEFELNWGEFLKWYLDEKDTYEDNSWFIKHFIYIEMAYIRACEYFNAALNKEEPEPGDERPVVVNFTQLPPPVFKGFKVFHNLDIELRCKGNLIKQSSISDYIASGKTAVVKKERTYNVFASFRALKKQLALQDPPVNLNRVLIETDTDITGLLKLLKGIGIHPTYSINSIRKEHYAYNKMLRDNKK